jgi:DNA-binding transcriptional regulator YiaG
MSSRLKARFAQLGPIRAINRVRSGFPVDLALRPARDPARVRAVEATRSLARRGLTLLRAKRTVEAMVGSGEAVVHLPSVESIAALAGELKSAGIAATRVGASAVDVKSIRSALGLTQEQFALRFGLDVDAVQNWEQGRCQPDRASAAYLRAIAANPAQVASAQEEAL